MDTATWRRHFNKICSQSERELRVGRKRRDLLVSPRVNMLTSLFES